MKLELGTERPESFRESWPGQYDFFSHFEFACGIPHALFVISTLKENGLPNACFHSWSCFSGDGGGFFAILPSLGMHAHTWGNMARTGEFCVNFLSADRYDACMATIAHNAEGDDEFAAAGFSVEKAATVSAPRIGESFLSLECRVHSMTDLSGTGVTGMVVGKVLSVAAGEDFAKGWDERYGEHGFMFNVHSPKDWQTGVGANSAICSLSRLREQA